MKRRYKFLFIFIVLLSIIIGASYFINRANAELEKLDQIQLTDVDLTSIEDGVYIGQYHSFPIEAIVSVTIEDHKITQIEIIKHLTGQGADAEDIIEDVIDFQSLEVDFVAGATYSSKVILLAIRNALTS